MIRFSLTCALDHISDGWFSSSEDFEKQKSLGLIACPICNSINIEKSLMTPQVSKSSNHKTQSLSLEHSVRKELISHMRKIRDKITENADYVGDKFPEEARKIHYGESEERSIYGQVGKEDAETLIKEGVHIMPLPIIPDDAN
ncbi:DUF1178 family protein [Candidatus Endowatersipora endosymbiont of Watersipora subatra]|uniref:DUF1178 family protein n=1 Tax=Candidatus Endowatersipora endosymbiont of Watersipora subatra TaxID=3077946 RepID=UPI00312CA106